MPNFHIDRLKGALVLALTVGLIGCFGKDELPESTIQGRVTLDGEPVKIGIVQFVNEDLGVGAKSDLDDNGNYFIDTPFLTGEYQVAILPPPPPDPILGGDPPKGPFIVPKKFTRFASSKLVAQLDEGENTYDIELNSK